MSPITRPRFATVLPALLFCYLAGLPAVAQQGDWPQWRGSDRSNASQETGLLKEWPADGPPLVWRLTGLGEGIHSVSVVDGRVFTVGNREGTEFAYALDAKTGEKLWATRLGKSISENPLMRWLTQRTPTVDGERVYAFTSGGDLLCLSSTGGRILWQRNYSADFGTPPGQWGYCDRPMVDGERLICTPFGSTAFIAALDKRTGKIIWQTKLDPAPRQGYAALITSEAGGVHQYVVFDAYGLSGFAADDGRPLWNYPRPGTKIGSTYTPIANGEDISSANGYGGGLVGIELAQEDGSFEVRELYQIKGNLFDVFQDSTAHVGDYFYTLQRSRAKDVNAGASEVVCIELKTGLSVWTGDSPPQIGRTALTYADGCLYLRNANGLVTLMQVSPQDRRAAGSFTIPEHEPSMGVTAPVVAGGRLYLRDGTRLYCYDISGGAFAKPRNVPLEAVIGLTVRELDEGEDARREPRVGVNRAPDAVYVSTPQDITERMLQEAGVKKTDVVVDLGSGDGRVVITAAKKYGCKAIGYEIDPRLVELSRNAVTKEGLQDLVRIEHADMFTADLSGADVVTAFLYPHLMERLIPQFEKLKPGSRIVSHQFELPGVKPDRELAVESKETGQSHRILLWTAPITKP